MGMSLKERREFVLMRSEITRLQSENQRLRASAAPLNDSEFEALAAELARDLALKPIVRIKAPSRVQASPAAAA